MHTLVGKFFTKLTCVQTIQPLNSNILQPCSDYVAIVKQGEDHQCSLLSSGLCSRTSLPLSQVVCGELCPDNVLQTSGYVCLATHTPISQPNFRPINFHKPPQTHAAQRQGQWLILSNDKCGHHHDKIKNTAVLVQFGFRQTRKIN